MTYRTRFSQVFSFSDRNLFAAKLCNLIIRTELHTIVTFYQIISFVPAHLINPDIFTPFFTWDNGSENINFLGCTGT